MAFHETGPNAQVLFPSTRIHPEMVIENAVDPARSAEVLGDRQPGDSESGQPRSQEDLADGGEVLADSRTASFGQCREKTPSTASMSVRWSSVSVTAADMLMRSPAFRMHCASTSSSHIIWLTYSVK